MLFILFDHLNKCNIRILVHSHSVFFINVSVHATFFNICTFMSVGR